MKKNLLLGVLFTLFVLHQAWAQTRTINGTVRSATDKATLPGVNVIIKGTTNGTTTNMDGQYNITVPDNATLVFSFIGFAPQEIAVGNRTVIDLQMEEDITKLTEVVVTAVGIEREKRALGYAVQEVGGNAIVESREPNLVNSLAGKVAGVQINNSGGQPGASSRIVIRGNNSVFGNNQPLFVIDGIPIDNSQSFGGGQTDSNGGGNGDSPLFNGGASNRGVDIDPNIIESVSVLKGAGASALYGSRAANGVILITTKSGKGLQNKKGPQVSLSSTFGWDEARIDGFQDQYLQGLNGVYRNGLPATRGGYSENGGLTQGSTSWGPHKDSVSQKVLDDIGMPQIYDPRAAFYQTGRTYDNSISLAGASDRFNYFTSYSDFRQEGIVPGTKFNRHNFTVRFGASLSDKIEVTASLKYAKTMNRWLAEGNGARSYLFGLNFTPISFDISQSEFEDGTQRNFVATGFNNPLWLAKNNSFNSDVDRFIPDATITYKALPWLSFRETIGIDTYFDSRKKQDNVGTFGTPGLNGGMYDENIQWRQINSDFIITAEKSFNSDFSGSLILGNQINSRFLQRELQNGAGLSEPGFYNIQNALQITASEYTEKRNLFGIYAQAAFDYKSMLILTLTGRNDWSSTLPKQNRSFFYPSAGLSFVFTELAPLAGNTILPFGKLRLAYGEIGNDAPAYSLATGFIKSNPGDGQRGNIDFPFQGLNAFELDNVQGNPNLRPERTKEFEVGLELQLLKNRLGIDATYYDRRTVDQIYDVPVSPATGYVSRLLNSGEISNKGVELALTATPVIIGAFKWDAQVNFTRNRSEIVSLAEGVETIRLGGFTSPGIFIRTGQPYGVIWGSRFARNDAGQLLIDEDGFPVVAPDLGPIGSVQPKWTSGIRNTFSWKGLSLSTLVDIREGGDVLNFDLFYSTFYGTAEITEVRGTPKVWEGVNETTGQPNTTPLIQDGPYFRNWFSNVDENFVEDGSFIKVREINLTYRLPQSLISKTPFQSVSLSAIGRNLFVKTDFSYGDPEGSLYGSANAQGFYHAVTPGTKSYTVGLRITL